MKHTALMLLVTVCVTALSLQGSYAADATNRAASLKTWRTQCSDPDPDMQIGYLEEAIALKDESILRICLRQTLNSDNADTRNLALRTAISARNRIIFETTMPAELTNAYKKAEKDKRKKKEVDGSPTARLYSVISNGLIFDIQNAELGSNRSLWFPIAGNTKADDRFSGRADVVGTKVIWTGEIAYTGGQYTTCDLQIKLVRGSRLEGTLKCEGMWTIPVRAPLF
ncbi:hypothetical protein [Dethiosulfatarculus sandiegensis]|uniref:Uncharacterized protein n=1 Tax=Dethiosulfatarculus sandiegensis TaxID=1429043 RepID=A0A0D2HML7_9BACT|nr:hypothetical protein [Dethiosulfatarculus sandiegensis]KIX11843.1 hypothetical protein X474_22160 [Dethiosulfatarculus sandiegensis]